MARSLLDAAVSRSIVALAHDLRNALGVVSMQVEAIAARTGAAAPDVAAIRGHAETAGNQIERLADMTNALIAFARGRTTSDLVIIVGGAVALVPLRAIAFRAPPQAAAGVDPALARAVVLEALILVLQQRQPPEIEVVNDSDRAHVHLRTGATVTVDDAVEWVVQFRRAGGHIDPTDDGLRLQFPLSA